MTTHSISLIHQNIGNKYSGGGKKLKFIHAISHALIGYVRKKYTMGCAENIQMKAL